MIDSLKANLLRWLRVPPEIQTPAGSTDSLRVFRAAPNFWRLQLFIWIGRQLFTVLGLVVALTLLRSEAAERLSGAIPVVRSYEPIVLIVEAFGLLGFLVQLPLSYLIARLNFELRWYLVTDRSLRLRKGIWTVEELTMTFANIQELTIQQNPWQRLLGISDLKVRSAGGGATHGEGHNRSETHVAYFHGVDNAEEIRDLIQERLRRQRDTGLGDPGSPVEEPLLDPATDPLAAAREVLSEVRSLRTQLGQRNGDTLG